MSNLNSLTELTEFTPLSSETKQTKMASLFSKLFKFSSGELPEEVNQLEDNFTSTECGSIEEENTPENNWNIDDTSRTGENLETKIASLSSGQYSPNENQIEIRTLPNVLRRVSSLLASRNKNATLCNDTNLKKYWMPDSVSKECYECGEKFTAFRRRHHCRICGQIFCSQCCNREVPGKIIGCTGTLRVCTYCCKVVLSYLRDTDQTVDLKALQDDLLYKFGNSAFGFEETQTQDTLKNINDDKNIVTEPKRKISVVYQEENFTSSRSMGSTSSQQTTNSKPEMAHLNTLLYELMRSDNGLQLHDYIADSVKYESCFTGSQLVDWLISQRKTFSRTHSLAIGQVLLYANLIKSVHDVSTDFVDGPTRYQFRTTTSHMPNESPEQTSLFSSEKTTRISRSGFHLDINITKNTAHISRHPLKVSNMKDRKKSATSYTSDITEEIINDFSNKYLRLRETNTAFASDVNESSFIKKDDEADAFSFLTSAFEQHLTNLVNQLLTLEQLPLSWSEIIISLANQALQKIQIDFNKIDVCDIGHYVKIKKLSGGEREDSCVIEGLVCSKNVAHREMKTHLRNPRILLLQCAVVYQRMEGRLMSLEPVIMQEEQYLRHVVARIAALEPNLILVHRNVSRLAQESLNALGVTLVLNVKMSVMERIARCTNADIVTSVDAIIGTTQLGSCRSFYINEYVLKDGCVKNLMFFDGCTFSQLGCTIILRGASSETLKKLKRVTNSMVFSKYNAKLEKSFLLEEFAKAPKDSSFSIIKDDVRNFVDKLRIVALHHDDKTKKDENADKAITPQLGTKKLAIASEEDTDEKTGDSIDKPFIGLEEVKNTSDDGGKQSVNVVASAEENFFKKSLENRVLSYSLFIEFNVPYLETTAGSQSEVRQYFPNEIYYTKGTKNDGKREIIINNEVSNVKSKSCENNHSVVSQKRKLHEFVVTKLKNDITSGKVKKLLASYRASGGRLVSQTSNEKESPLRRNIIHTLQDKKNRICEMNCIDPRNHQRLAVLFCSFSQYSSNSPEFCVNPWTVTMDFYGCNDIPLGSFLEKYCFQTSYMCPSENCETPMLDHERRFVHDGGCLHVTLSELDSLPNRKNHQILFWSVCTTCKISTPIVAMSNDTWNLSFAKYLELRFHGGQYKCRANAAQSCQHSLHHDYCQYFYHRNIVASFKYSDILRWEISLPSKVLEIHPSKFQTEVVLDEIKKWAVMGHEIFSSIFEKLNLLETDDVVIKQTLMKSLLKEQVDFKHEVDNIQVLLTNPTLINNLEIENFQDELNKIEDKVTLMKKTVAKNIVNWGSILLKLDSKKKDDRQKNKSFSNDSTERSTPLVLNVDDSTIQLEECDVCNAVKESKKEVPNCLEDNNDDNVGKNKDDDGKTTLVKDGNIISVDTTTDGILNDLLQNTPSQDKLSVKALFAQLLPNTFQSQPSSLVNPISCDEHHLLNRNCTVPIVVYESEISSVIAYALSTSYYQNTLDELEKNVDLSSSRNIPKKESSERVSVNSSAAWEFTHFEELEEASKSEVTETDCAKSRSGKISDAHYIEVNFADESTSFTVRVYFAYQFKGIRSLIFTAGENSFIRSLSRCVPWAAHGGKSGSHFHKTKDNRFILKEMGRVEIDSFLTLAMDYFDFIRCSSQRPTLLVKIVGVYYVKFRNTSTNQTSQKTFLVMENLFYRRDIIRKFDLKGSVRNRLVNMKSGHEGELVLLDENLINMTCVSPLYIYPHSKTVLMQAINNDVTFLASNCVVDYSLLVGLDETSQELVVGIIDYVRLFTWDKKLETLVKKSGLLGGQGKLPTIISPDEYKDRFINAMHKYFIAVPDQWHGFAKGINY